MRRKWEAIRKKKKTAREKQEEGRKERRKQKSQKTREEIHMTSILHTRLSRRTEGEKKKKIHYSNSDMSTSRYYYPSFFTSLKV